MNANFGLLLPLDAAIHSKPQRQQALIERALAGVETLAMNLEKEGWVKDDGRISRPV
jgi:folate-dependent tRNA-U54 methylase TrmFO/GidA